MQLKNTGINEYMLCNSIYIKFQKPAQFILLIEVRILGRVCVWGGFCCVGNVLFLDLREWLHRCAHFSLQMLEFFQVFKRDNTQRDRALGMRGHEMIF